MEMISQGKPSPVVDVVDVAVQRPPMQQAVRPVEPGVVQHIQRRHRGYHIQHLATKAPPHVALELPGETGARRSID